MSQDWLYDLSLLSIERDVADKINKVIREFAHIKAREVKI